MMLLWQLPKRHPEALLETLHEARRRYFERTGTLATAVYVHADDAERLSGCGLAVVVDRGMLKGHLGVGRES